jgi:CheY-like chemotaxis protein
MPPAAPRTVLLVQAVRDDREMYSEFLRAEGFYPVAVSSAADALAVARRAHIVVTAILIPGQMDGPDLIARLKHDERTSDIPVIVLTTCGWQSDRKRAHAAGCDAYLTKPCLPEVLVKEIRRVLADRPLQARQPAGKSPSPVRRAGGSSERRR